MRTGLIWSKIWRTNQVKAGVLPIIPDSIALSRKLMFCDKLIMFCANQTPERQEPNNHFHHVHLLPLFLNRIKKKNDMATHQSKMFESKKFLEKKTRNFYRRAQLYL